MYLNRFKLESMGLYYQKIEFEVFVENFKERYLGGGESL